MQTDELTHQNLAPKARSSYGFLHLMGRDEKRMRFVVVLGAERLSIQPALLLQLTDRLRKRLAHEADQPWHREYIANCAVVNPRKPGEGVTGMPSRADAGVAPLRISGSGGAGEYLRTHRIRWFDG